MENHKLQSGTGHLNFSKDFAIFCVMDFFKVFAIISMLSFYLYQSLHGFVYLYVVSGFQDRLSSWEWYPISYTLKLPVRNKIRK